MIKEFELTQKQFDKIIEASQATPVLFGADGSAPTCPQERSNHVWKVLGEALGFEWTSVHRSAKGDRFFTAKEK